MVVVVVLVVLSDPFGGIEGAEKYHRDPVMGPRPKVSIHQHSGVATGHWGRVEIKPSFVANVTSYLVTFIRLLQNLYFNFRICIFRIILNAFNSRVIAIK